MQTLHVGALFVPNISHFTGFPIPRPSAVFCFAWPWCPPTCNGTRQCLQGHFSNQPPPGRISNFANNPMWGCYSRTHLLPSQWPLKPCWTKISWISPPFIAKPCGNLKKRDTKMAKKVNEIILLFFLLILDNHHLHHRIPKLHPDFSSPSTVMIIWTWNRDATVFKIMAMLLLIVVTIISIDTKWCCFNQEENTYSWSHTEQRRKASWKVKITFNEDSSPSQSPTSWSTIKAIFLQTDFILLPLHKYHHHCYNNDQNDINYDHDT